MPAITPSETQWVPFDTEMNFPSASDLEETEDAIDEGEAFSSDTLEVLNLMETVR